MSEYLKCISLTTETGSIIELWEGDDGFELLFAEAHRPSEIVHVVELRRPELLILAEKLLVAVEAAEKGEE